MAVDALIDDMATPGGVTPAILEGTVPDSGLPSGAKPVASVDGPAAPRRRVLRPCVVSKLLA